jgi:ribosomal protein L37AE/L43A
MERPKECRLCDALDSARDDGHNSWVCRRCGAWMGQVAPLTISTVRKAKDVA